MNRIKSCSILHWACDLVWIKKFYLNGETVNYLQIFDEYSENKLVVEEFYHRIF